MPSIQDAIDNEKTGNPATGSRFARISNTKLRLIILAIIAGMSLIIIAVALVHLIRNPELDNTSMAILISSMSTIVVAIIGVMAGTSLDADKN